MQGKSLLNYTAMGSEMTITTKTQDLEILVFSKH